MTSLPDSGGQPQTPAPWFALGAYADKITLPPGATDSPLAWVNHAREEVVRSLFPKEVFTKAPPDTATVAKVLGILHTVSDWFEQPLTPELEAKLAAAWEHWPEALRPTDVQMEESTQQWAQFIEQVPALIRQLSDLAQAQGFSVNRDFQGGYVKGVARVPADLGDDTQYSANQKLLLLLATLGPVVQAFPSVPALHKVLVKAMGEHKAGTLKNLSSLCRKIGLKLRPAGRPRKLGTARMAPARTLAR